MNPSEAFLRDQIPPRLRTLIPSTLKQAYSAADKVIAGEPILQVSSAQDNRGRIIQWAVDLGFQRLVESQRWPFEWRWMSFAKPTGRYLEIRPSHSVLTISQVKEAEKQPRDVCFRANKRLANQGWLPGFPNPLDKEPNSGLPHILLVHGYQSLNFAQLGVPNERHCAGYKYRTDNLMKLPHEIVGDEHPMEDTEVEAIMTLKEEIDKWRKDNGTE